MTSAPRFTRLDFHGPLSDDRAANIVARLARSSPATVLDIGCGWGELLLRLLAAVPGAEGTGVDVNDADLDRGWRTAAARGLAERVAYVHESGLDLDRPPADVVLSVGASQALTETPPPEAVGVALTALRGLVRPGGRVLYGECFWHRRPTAAELAAMWPDASDGEFLALGELVDAATAAGFRPEWIETAGRGEWEEFESGYLADVEEWLAANPSHPDADAERRACDEHRRSWLHGYHDVLGMAYLTLIPV